MEGERPRGRILIPNRADLKEASKAVAIYAFLHFGFYISWSYVNPQARQLGLSKSEISFVSGMVPIVVFVGAPAVGYLSDRVGFKPILIGLLVFISAISATFVYAPKYGQVARFKVRRHAEATGLEKVSEFGEYVPAGQACRADLSGMTVTEAGCGEKAKGGKKMKPFQYDLGSETLLDVRRGNCSSYEKNFCVYTLVVEEGGTMPENSTYCDANIKVAGKEGMNLLVVGSYSITMFVWVIFKVAYHMANNLVWSTTDTIAAKIAVNTKIEFAYISFFGGLSGIIAPITMGYLLDAVSTKVEEDDCITGQDLGKSDYSLPIFIFGGVNVLLALFLLFLNLDRAQTSRDEIKEEKRTLKGELSWMINPACLGFYLLQCVVGTVFTTIDVFYPIYMLEDIKVSDKWFGITNSLEMATGSILILVGMLIKKCIGCINLVFLVSILLSLRTFSLAYNRVYTSEDDIPYEVIFRAVGLLPIFMIGVVGYVDVIAPDRLKGTAISLSSGCIFFIGRGVGGFLGGWLDDLVGTRNMFIIMGLIGVVYTVVYMILFYAWVKRTEPRYNEMPPKQSHMEMA